MSSNITDESIASIPAKFRGLEREKVSKWTPKEKIVKLWFKSGQHSLQTQRQQMKHLGAGAVALLFFHLDTVDNISTVTDFGVTYIVNF